MPGPMLSQNWEMVKIKPKPRALRRVDPLPGPHGLVAEVAAVLDPIDLDDDGAAIPAWEEKR